MNVPDIYIFYFLIAMTAILLIWLAWLEFRLKRLFRGAKGRDIEGVIIALGKELEGLKVSRSRTEEYLKDIERRLRKSVQQVGIVRFNPFNDSGGDQSFVIALLDENGNGVVFSSLYSREHVRVYAKPIEEGKSRYPLSEEEKQAIEKAKHNI